MMSKLLAIQRDLKVSKSQVNNFGGYKYRSCEDVLEAVKPLCQREGLLLTLTDEVVQIGERYYIKATANLTDGNKNIYVSAMAREEAAKKGMDAAQITGAASSYARKYALNGLFCIDDTKDADTQDNTAQNATQQNTAQTLTPIDILNKIAAEGRKKGIRPEDLNKIIRQKYGKKSSVELTPEEVEDLHGNYEKYYLELVRGGHYDKT